MLRLSNARFVKLALRTESKDYSAIAARLSDPKTLENFLGAMAIAKEVLQALDVLKKHGFYGKDVALPAIFAARGLEEVKRLQEMGIDPYKEFPAKFDPNDPRMIRTIHAAIGLSTEGGEVLEAVQKALERRETLDQVNILEEAGDIFWYLAVLADSNNFSFTAAMIRVIQKLAKRYGKLFSKERALNRDLAAERKVLEG